MNEVRPIVRIIQGQLRGIVQKTINGKPYTAFKGIPYAKPPIGELRFQDPRPAESWSYVKDASKFGSICAQYDVISRSFKGSEDCLFLNVYTPTDLMGSQKFILKPVMFWIHGGSFAFGCGDDLLHGPDYIVEKDVILVTINYRLHVFGFLNLENEEVTGNQGLKDQVLALKWVQENIANFGGDPKNVTIFGESAGGSSVHYLTLSPLAEGLFHKAISQSSVAINPWANTADSPKRYAQQIARLLGKDIQDSKILLEFLRSIDAQKLAEINKQISAKEPSQLYVFVPSIDEKSKNPFMPIPVKIAAQKGVKVPYMIGHTSAEGVLFLAGLSEEKMKYFDSHFEKIFTDGMMKMIKERGLEVSDVRKIHYGEKSVSMETRQNYADIHSELLFICGIHEVIEIQAKRNESPTYYYKFSYDNGKSLVKVHFQLDLPGACHADDVPYILYPKILESFGVPRAEKGSIESLVIERVTQMWTNFAKTGNPTPAVSETLPVVWKPVKNSEKFEFLNISEDLQMESTTNLNERYVKKSTSKL